VTTLITATKGLSKIFLSDVIFTTTFVMYIIIYVIISFAVVYFTFDRFFFNTQVKVVLSLHSFYRV